MRGRRGVQTVERFGDHADRAVETDAVLGDEQVVVHRLGYADHSCAVLGEPRRHAERVVAADGDERLEVVVLEVAQHLLAPALALHGVDPRAAQHGAADGKDPGERGPPERHDVAVAEEACPAVANADDRVTVEEGAAPDRTDRCVEAGGVTTAGEDPDLHANALPSEPPLVAHAWIAEEGLLLGATEHNHDASIRTRCSRGC